MLLLLLLLWLVMISSLTIAAEMRGALLVPLSTLQHAK